MKHVVGFSGGADSQVVAALVRDEFPAADVLLLNSDPGGNEHDATYGFIRWYSENVFPVVTVQPIVTDLAGKEPGMVRKLGLDPETALTFDLLAKIKQRFPSDVARFCTTVLKMAPTRRYLQDRCAEEGWEMFLGVRRDESRKRANIPDHGWDDYFDCPLHYPIAAWSKEQVFDFIKARGEQVNPLYTMGFERVGCSPCMEWGKDAIRNWAARCPDGVEKVRRWEKEVGYTFFGPIMPKGRFGLIDEVIAWSRTLHGGRQMALPTVEAEAESGGCSSKYGLCE